MDVDASHGAALGRALPSTPGDIPLSRRLRSFLSFQGNEDDPVTTLTRTHRHIHPSADAGVLRRSYAVAENMHRGQFRKSGDPYITHPLAVAQICAELGMDTTTLVAALLHDTVEDTSYTLETLHGDFGPEVTHLVDGVTKFDKAFYGKVAEAETIRKMIVAAGKDVRVLVIKLADRLHNMRTLDARSPASRARIATATLDVLVPLCDRLGIQALKRDLDDVVLYHLEPDSYARIDEHVKNRPGWSEYLEDVKTKASTALRRSRVDAKVAPRPRHYYSIWKDTVAGGHPVPLDLPRIAVIVDGPETDCYAALGAIHGQWRPVAEPVQGLHRLPEEQPLPLPAHHRHRARRPPGGGAHQDGLDAPLRGIRRGDRLPLPQVRRGGRDTGRRPAHLAQAGARLGAGHHRRRASSSRRCAATSPRARSRCSRTATPTTCRPARPRSTWPTS
nr:hypothetical protein GCM10020092_087080 [Actinoplanes digitatis]